MKIFLTVIALLTSLSCLSQQPVRKKIGELKISHQIDSMLTDAIKKAVDYDSVLVITVYTINGVSTFLFSDFPDVKSVLLNLIEKRNEVGYFAYKEYTVFVAGDFHFLNLFKKTENFKWFTFIKRAPSTNGVFHIKKFTPWLKYEYSNNAFVGKVVMVD